MLSFIFASALFACSPEDPQQPSGETVTVDDTGERLPPDDSAVEVDADEDGSPASVDCDDGNPEVNPDADELCNGIDDNCDGFIDVGAIDALTLYPDADGDGFGGGAGMATCDSSAGIANGGDCDDGNASVHPGACEDPFDALDDDCSGVGDTQVPVAQTLEGSTSPMTDEFQTARVGAVALRVVASSTSRSSTTRVVHFAATQPTVLVLASDTAVTWEVDEAVAGTLERILVVSRSDDAKGSGPKGVPVDLFTGNDSLFDAPRMWGEVTARKMENALLEETKLEVSSWIFSPAFDALTIEDTDTWPEVTFEYTNPICPTADATPFGDPDTTPFPADCQKIIAKGGTVCLTTNAAATFLFDLEGESCQVIPAGIDLDMGPSASIGWRGDYVYGCGMDDAYQLIRVRLSDGAVERSYRYCTAVTDWDDQILAQDASTGIVVPMRPFGSWADVVSSDVPAGIPGDLFNLAIATRDDVLYATWFSDDQISSFSLTPPYGQLPDILLEDYNFYMGGLDVTDDDFIVLKGSVNQRKMLVFDMDGATVTSFFLPLPSAGVSCFTP